MHFLETQSFVVANVAGSVAWATFYSVGASMLGKQIAHASGAIGIAISVFALAVFVVATLLVHRHERRLTAVPPMRQQRRQRAMARAE